MFPLFRQEAFIVHQVMHTRQLVHATPELPFVYLRLIVMLYLQYTFVPFYEVLHQIYIISIYSLLSTRWVNIQNTLITAAYLQKHLLYLNSMYSYRQKGDTRLKKKGKTSLRPFNSLHRTECHLSLLTLVTLQINHQLQKVFLYKAREERVREKVFSKRTLITCKCHVKSFHQIRSELFF